MDSQKYVKFSLRLQNAYRENPYHSSVHAADVVQNVYYYLIGGGAQERCKTTTLDLASLFISAAAHDVDHPGTNNIFEQKTKSKLSILYNDVAILENHHAATFFFLMEED
jgi:cAMP-specific phosphodiesterase 4